MSDRNKWRFPNNDYGSETGLDEGNVETFKKDPEAALAREIGQNSIDANNGKGITKIEFKSFIIDKCEIPGIDDLEEQIKRCYEYKKDLEKEAVPLKRMLDYLKQDKVLCLRISDFNTKGLLGVKSYDNTKPFYLLTKGTGVSHKEGSSGGSKGIGKYASFVNSVINTVFYSTYTEEEEEGYIGVSKLRSAPIPGAGRLLTQGMGYFSLNKEKGPIFEQLVLDPMFKRNQGQYGTDLYVIGFEGESGWENSIICKLLESFMVAFSTGNLEAVIEDTVINKDTLDSVVKNEEIYNVSTKREIREIKEQYSLLTDPEVSRKKVAILNYGEVEIFVKKHGQQTAIDALHKCVMVRYPYMKIKVGKNLSQIPFSALCIIEDNELNKMLRKTENPQHTEWELKRLRDNKTEQRKTREAKNKLEDEILSFVKEVLLETSSSETDVEGAGDFLPDLNEGNSDGVFNSTSGEEMTVGNLKKQNNDTDNKKNKGEDEEALEFTNGEVTDENGDEGEGVGGQGGGDIPPVEPNPIDDDGEGNKITDGDGRVRKKVLIGGIKFRNIAVNPKEGIYDVLFTSLNDEEDCELEIRQCGSDNDKYIVEIEEATINGEKCNIENGVVNKFAIKKGCKYKLSYKAKEKRLYSSEVVLSAYKE